MTTILVVDDSGIDRRLVCGLLQQAGEYQIITAEDGADAIRKITAQSVDLVLTDLNMPELDGLQLVSALRKSHPAVPVILMTAIGSEEIAVAALKAGAASYVPKQRLNQDLLEIVEQVRSLAKENRNRARLQQRMTRHEYQLAVENDPELLAFLVTFLQDCIVEMGICNDHERLRVGVALQETLTNACYHGNLEVSSTIREVDHQAYYDLARKRMDESPYRERRIQIEASFSRQEARIIVRDEGPGFDPGEIPDPTDLENLDRPCGRGLLLMRTFLDEVTYNDRGNQVTLVKRTKSS